MENAVKEEDRTYTPPVYMEFLDKNTEGKNELKYCFVPHNENTKEYMLKHFNVVKFEMYPEKFLYTPKFRNKNYEEEQEKILKYIANNTFVFLEEDNLSWDDINFVQIHCFTEYRNDGLWCECFLEGSNYSGMHKVTRKIIHELHKRVNNKKVEILNMEKELIKQTNWQNKNIFDRLKEEECRHKGIFEVLTFKEIFIILWKKIITTLKN